MSGTPRQLIVSDRNTITLSWYTFSDTQQWPKLVASINVIRPRIYMNAGKIISQNLGVTLLVVRRADINIAFDLLMIAVNAQNSADTNIRIAQLIQKINSFLSIAPLP